MARTTRSSSPSPRNARRRGAFCATVYCPFAFTFSLGKRKHLSGSGLLCITVPDLETGGQLVSTPFHILSRNRKYAKSGRRSAPQRRESPPAAQMQEQLVQNRCSHTTTTLPAATERQALVTMPLCAPVCTVGSASDTNFALGPLASRKPVLVDEHTTLTLMGDTTSTSFFLTTLFTVGSHLSPQPVIMVTLLESDCFAEFVIKFTEKQPVILKRRGHVLELGGSRFVAITSVEQHEFPTMFQQTLQVMCNDYVVAGRVRFLQTIVY
eukprot:TRINITY_DN2444_c0_g1_i1.p1 TRINITY_DN2444_c0_g1~~TRINITY_DN2444_c0_g1_i1.p1  ORF type:complete len:267 (+),score=32.92 TRINITY_DN2444_c0_g1_i1:248-1048(+)